jgi:hypothetical protein
VKNLEGKPFALIGVNGLDHEPRKLKEVMEREKLNWRSFGGRAVAAQWNPRSTPSYYLIDHKGVIRRKWQGYPGMNAIDAALERLIREAEEDATNPSKAR